MINTQLEQNVTVFLDKDYDTDTFAKWAGNLLSIELEPRDFRGLDFEVAVRQARDAAERMAESQVFEAVEENLPEGKKTIGIGKRWRNSPMCAGTPTCAIAILKKVGRDGVADVLLKIAEEAIAKIDLSEGARFLEPDYGIRTACGWVHYKFGIEVPIDQARKLEPAELIELLRSKAREAYDLKEAEYPVMAGLYHFTTRDASGQKRYDRDQLVAWARDRFQVNLDLEDLKNKQRDDIRAVLIEHSRSQSAESSANLGRHEAAHRRAVRRGRRQRRRWPNHRRQSRRRQRLAQFDRRRTEIVRSASAAGTFAEPESRAVLVAGVAGCR